MPESHNFEHLPLLMRHRGPALLTGGGNPTPQTIANRQSSARHSAALLSASGDAIRDYTQYRGEREAQGRPVLPSGVPLLLQVDPGLDLDALRHHFEFEIISEEEEGYVIVASEDLDLTLFREAVAGFAVQVHGTATIAQVHRLGDDPNQESRLRRILSETLFEAWPRIRDDQEHIVDVGIACAGTVEIPKEPVRGKRDTDASWAKKEEEWATARSLAYSTWDLLKMNRENDIENFSKSYGAEILHIIEEGGDATASLPDSFSVRLRISGLGLRDLVFTYAYVFEVVEPDDIELPQRNRQNGSAPPLGTSPIAPDQNAPVVCVIDSGIQEGHVLLSSALVGDESHCFLPNVPENQVADLVKPGGHGTRVAGAILYGESVQPLAKHLFWIQNARVLDENCRMPTELYPPEAIRAVVMRFHEGPRTTRIFNQSINAAVGCRLNRMSAWAAEIDALSEKYDILIIQTGGNISFNGPANQPGIRDHLLAGRDYPAYLREHSSRVSNPAQSLQALTVGSVAYGNLQNDSWRTFADTAGAPSAFSRTGPSLWDAIKPEVVEYGGDDVRSVNGNDVNTGSQVNGACPELIRSTAFPPGPAYSRDESGTSFAAPKVTRIAAKLNYLLPDQPALLYRALIVQSARWPDWAEQKIDQIRRLPPGENDQLKEQLILETSNLIRSIGYGIPDDERATTNTDFRVTAITGDVERVHAGECHIYQVPIPEQLRGQADEYDIRIDVSLSWVAQPRRTRRKLRRYFSTWVDWKSSKLGEGLKDFCARALKSPEEAPERITGSSLPWTLQKNPDHGYIREVKSNGGTVQKDWAVVKSNSLPDQFCIAVVGHQGWSKDPDSTAKYALAVSFEIVGQEIAIYEPLKVAIEALEAESGVEVESEAEIEIDEEA
jgi:hypothetical protein